MFRMTKEEFVETIQKQVDEPGSTIRMFMLRRGSLGQTRYKPSQQFISLRMGMGFEIKTFKDGMVYTVEFFELSHNKTLVNPIDIDSVSRLKPRYVYCDEMRFSNSVLTFILYAGEIDNFNYEFTVDSNPVAKAQFDLVLGKIKDAEAMDELIRRCREGMDDVNGIYLESIVRTEAISRLNQLVASARKPSPKARKLIELINEVEDGAKHTIVMKMLDVIVNLVQGKYVPEEKGHFG